MKTLLSSAILAIALMAPAAAAPVTALQGAATPQQDQARSVNPGMIEVGWRHGRHGWHGGHGWHRHHHRYGWGPAIGGFAAGAIVGSALASSHAQASANAYCEQKYRSYDPASGTYLGYDGQRHPCP
jgi:hypothetical protein